MSKEGMKMKKRRLPTLILIGVMLIVAALLRFAIRAAREVDAVSGATQPAPPEGDFAAAIPGIQAENEKSRAIIFLYSHGNTQKIADAIAAKINAPILMIEAINTDAAFFSHLDEYELIGFGSGIDSGKHFQILLDFADKLPSVENKKAFIFSTSGHYREEKMMEDHETLKKILQDKGFVTTLDFSCPGHNTNSILKLFGGMNKDRPNADDLRNAELFAEELLSR
jgi:flavodoxin